MALSTALPTLTLESALEHHFQWIATRKHFRGDPNDIEPPEGASQIKSSKQFNPEGKVLTLEQERQLQVMIQEFDARSRPVYAAERMETIQALARAAAAGRIESIELTTPDTQDANILNRAHEADYARMKELLGKLNDRYGREGIDWAYAQAPSTAPDGIARSNIVYFFPAEEPEVFRLRAQGRAIMIESQNAYIRYFESIR